MVARRNGTLGSLEIGRFVAASVVVLSHFLPDVVRHAAGKQVIFGGLNPPGPLGLQYFFVLSGFVMMVAHGADRGDLRAVPNFWGRRVARIYPMYWLGLLIPLSYLYHGLTPERLAELIGLQPIGSPELVPPAWSLRYELCFYFMFGLWLLPYAGRPLLGLWILGVAWKCWWYFPRGFAPLPVPAFPAAVAGSFAGEFFDPLAIYFLAGLLGGWVYRSGKAGRIGNLLLLAAGLGILLRALPLEFWGYIYGRPVVRLAAGLGFAAIIAGLAGLERDGVLKFGRFARGLGMVSYPLYILHAPLFLLLDRWTAGLALGTPGLYMLALLGLGYVYGISMAATFWLDQPLQRCLRRLFAIRSRAPI